MIERVEVLPGPGTTVRYGQVVIWAGPTASPALLTFLVRSARNVGGSSRGGRQIVDHIAGILTGRDPEPGAPFAAVGPADGGWLAILHGPVQLWDGVRWLAPTPTPGWLQSPVVPQPAVSIGPAGSAAPRLDLDSPYDLQAGMVPGGGLVLVTNATPFQPAAPPAAAPVAARPDGPAAPLTPSGGFAAGGFAAGAPAAPSAPAGLDRVDTEPPPEDLTSALPMAPPGTPGFPAPVPLEGPSDDAPLAEPTPAPPSQPSADGPPGDTASVFGSPVAGSPVADVPLDDAPEADPPAPPGPEAPASPVSGDGSPYPQGVPSVDQPDLPANPFGLAPRHAYPAEPADTGAPVDASPEPAAPPAAADDSPDLMTPPAAAAQSPDLMAPPQAVADESPDLMAPPPAAARMPVPPPPPPQPPVPQPGAPLPPVVDLRRPGMVPLVDAPAPPAIEVDGVRCDADHLNHPDARTCIRCRRPLDGRPRGRGPRPPLGLLIGDDGRVLRLDRDLVIGSSPTDDPTVAGGRAAAVVMVGADGSVSPAHAELRLTDWAVSVIDRGSAGGTFVVDPGQSSWTRLQPFRPTPLRAGSHLSLGQRVLTFVGPWPAA